MRNEVNCEDGKWSKYAWDHGDQCPFCILILPPSCIKSFSCCLNRELPIE